MNLVALFRLAALVYLERTAHNFSGQSPKLDAWTGSAFDLIASLRACKHGFPLFVFGCEARTDARRIVILDAINETAKRTRSLNMQSLLRILQTIWNQDDLEVGHELDYNDKLDTILSLCETVPSFA